MKIPGFGYYILEMLLHFFFLFRSFFDAEILILKVFVFLFRIVFVVLVLKRIHSQNAHN